MKYFSQFPTFLAKIGDSQKAVEDFFIRVRPGKNYTSSSVLLLSTYIKDGERPEDISYRFYNSADYYWVVLLINGIVDPRAEWPMADQDVYTYTLNKYGSTTDVHHYRTVNGHFEISAYTSLLNQGLIEPVDNLTYEQEVNEAKRQIKVLNAQYLTEFVSEFQHQVMS